MMGSKWDSLDHRRKFFRTADTGIFEVIEQAIRVAATDHPKELKHRRDRFAGHLLIFKLRRCSGRSKKEDKGGERSFENSSKREIAAATTNSSLTASSDTLVNPPCSISFGGVVSVVDEEEKSRVIMENSKKRIRDGYQRAENAKKLLRIQVIDLKDLPNQEIGNQIVRIAIANKMMELKPDYHLSYVLLANIYRTVGRWDDALKIRRLMEDKGIQKMPGKSWIEVKGNMGYSSPLRKRDCKDVGGLNLQL